MKKLSIKLRVTLWFTAMMVLIVALVFGFMLTISGAVVESDAKSRLVQVAENNAGEVEYDDGELDVDDDFDFFRNGVYSLVYSHTGMLLDGQLPSGFTAPEALAEGEPRLVAHGGERYLLYDICVRDKHSPELWVRSIVTVDENSSMLGIILRIAAVTLPLLVAAAALGGYAIAKQAFRPVERISEAAEQIGDGKDLTRRIDIGEGDDEIHRLAGTFNRMFARLEASFEAEKQFTSDASHELRTPTSVIMAQCDYALGHDRTTEDYGESLRVIQRQAGKMHRLISQLLSFTRLEQGQEPLASEQTNLSELVTMLCEDVTATEEKGISLRTEIAPGISGMVDRTLFARLLTNLVNNACAYGRRDGTVTVRLIRENDLAVLWVEDDGIGIPAGEQEKIWRRFYQVNPSRTADKGGVGLGLSMVKQIAELHGGSVGVASEAGKGARFYVKLPVDHSPKDSL